MLFDRVALCRSSHDNCRPEKQDRDPPFYGCRHVDWDDYAMRCGKFNVLAAAALSANGEPSAPALALEVGERRPPAAVAEPLLGDRITPVLADAQAPLPFADLRARCQPGAGAWRSNGG